jgi:hypothetical protein
MPMKMRISQPVCPKLAIADRILAMSETVQKNLRVMSDTIQRFGGLC